MFLERLSTISGRIKGAVALSLIARDGIPVESFSADPNLDLEALAAELVSQLRVISGDHQELDVGNVQLLAISTEQLILMVSEVTAEYYLMLVLTDPSSYGRARFELRRARLILEDDLL